ncbi:MAG: hypothetical protein JO224_11895 [Pelomonas sp.]|nr:hypothetical protein [Roseateles sp.]
MSVHFRFGRRLRAPVFAAAALAAACVAPLLLGGCERQPEAVKFIQDGKPEHLSDWHVLHSDGRHLELGTGVVPYDLNTPLFSDYAHKLRTIWMPAGQAAAYADRATFDFPVGTVISKTFYYPKGQGGQVVASKADSSHEIEAGRLDLARYRLVETRLLVRRESGWVALPYVWNADQTEAELARTGDVVPMDIAAANGAASHFAYVVPNENQCASCHMLDVKSRKLAPIGPKARHLNRDFRYVSADGEHDENQLAHLIRVGYLTGVPGAQAGPNATLTQAELDALPRNADWSDPKAPLDARARAYLDVNCSHCHSPTGPANTTALNLEPFLAPDAHLGLCKPPVAAGKGTGDRLFDIVPGAPDESIMLYRLASTEGGVMMPELGRTTVHREGLALIRAWVAAMSGGCVAAHP